MPTIRCRARIPPSATCRRTDSPRSSGSEGTYLLHTATGAALLSTDHLLAPSAVTVKQLGILPFQVLQKPSLSSFQLPSPLAPPFASGVRVTLPSGVNTILNFTPPDGVVALKASPVKKVDWISAGVSLVAADAPASGSTAQTTIPALIARIAITRNQRWIDNYIRIWRESTEFLGGRLDYGKSRRLFRLHTGAETELDAVAVAV